VSFEFSIGCCTQMSFFGFFSFHQSKVVAAAMIFLF